MAWTTIPNKNAGDLMDDTWYDDHFQANMNWLYDEVTSFAIQLTNDGTAVVEGDVVSISTGGSNAAFVKTTATADPDVIGVAAESIANNVSGKVYVVGSGSKATINVNGTVAIGDPLQSDSATAGYAKAGGENAFAIALSANASGAGTVTAYLIHERANLCIAERTANLSTGASSDVTITLPDDSVDNQDLHSTISNTERITIPEDGIYAAFATIEYTVATSAILGIRNSSAATLAAGYIYTFSANTDRHTVGGILNLTAASDAYLYMFSHCGASRTVPFASLALFQLARM